jgi:predicted nucleic acid-binding protein
MSTQPAGNAAAETILCDTSFVSIVQSAGDNTRSARSMKSWPAATRARLNAAILAISVITLAELRDGHIYGKWGEARRARAEGLIGSYLLIPLDMAIVDCCAELRATCRREGVTVPDNDIWIAATANTRGWPLVSCDAHFDAIPDVDHIRLNLL